MRILVSPRVVVGGDAVAAHQIIAIPPNNPENSWAVAGWVSHSQLGSRIYASNCGAVFMNNTWQLCAPEDLDLDIIPICASIFLFKAFDTLPFPILTKRREFEGKTTEILSRNLSTFLRRVVNFFRCCCILSFPPSKSLFTLFHGHPPVQGSEMWT